MTWSSPSRTQLSNQSITNCTHTHIYTYIHTYIYLIQPFTNTALQPVNHQLHTYTHIYTYTHTYTWSITLGTQLSSQSIYNCTHTHIYQGCAYEGRRGQSAPKV